MTCIKLVVEAFLESCRVCLSNMLLWSHLLVAGAWTYPNWSTGTDEHASMCTLSVLCSVQSDKKSRGVSNVFS